MKILDGRNMLTRPEAHDELKRVLELPEYYGRNLDALYDLASTMEDEVALINAAPMKEALGMYGEKLITVLIDAQNANPGFRFAWKD